MRGIRQFDRRRSVPARLAIALAAVGAAALMRLGMEAAVPGVVPFAFTFPVVILATLFAGAMSGSLAAVGCQLLTVLFVLPHWTATHGGTPTDLASLVVSSASLAMMIWPIAAFRRLSRRLRRQCEREVGTLSLLVGEMDHRTKNNFQIAAALLGAQARAAGNGPAAAELDAAAARLVAIAAVYRRLSLAAAGGGFALAPYLHDLVDALREAVLPANVSIATDLGEVSVDSQTGLVIGLIVNEWVANAVKYAFGGAPGHITVRARADRGEVVVEVADDGLGRPAEPTAGTGSKLLLGLAEAIAARIEIRGDPGTRCTLHLPAARRAPA